MFANYKLVVFRGPSSTLSDVVFPSKMKRFLVAEMQETDRRVDGDIENELEMELTPSICFYLSVISGGIFG